ncbi:FecR family protein [Muriicola sp. Z0-33]|uniref:FecR family protein n=1 Tax=Muriicola sp. Z0-33 TaxID=2816957 RepID=UPI0022390C42|nr:FecR family protein [Muriicola sp. Z0-33]MCW5515723.1 FecR family protein [Muriicola sp. Z0-33]
MNKDYLIQKWLTEELTPEEQKAFEALEDVSFLKGIADDAKNFRASQFSKAKTYSDFKKVLDIQKAPVRKLYWVRPLMRIASIFIVGFAMYYFFFYENLTHVETQFGEKVTINLPDESSVSVNALSEIAYNEKNWNKERKIKLEGEAFFDVAKGKQFVVSTPQGEVTVLGTEFNVKQRENFFEVKCFEGTVRVTLEEYESVLNQGDNVRWYNGVVEQSKNTYSVPQWTKNISDFQRVAISQVFSELERQYGVTVTLEHIDEKRLFTGGFVHDNLDNALKSITVPLDLDYVILQTDKVRVKPREK